MGRSVGKDYTYTGCGDTMPLVILVTCMCMSSLYTYVCIAAICSTWI